MPIKKLFFLGLNPSIATASTNDHTITRLINFAKIWGYGYLRVINLFARIAKSPDLLRDCHDPVGEENNSELSQMMEYWAFNKTCDLWIGWGVKGQLFNRNIIVLQMIRKFWLRRHNNFTFRTFPYVIGLTQGGHPKHPLYASKRLVLEPFELISDLTPRP